MMTDTFPELGFVRLNQILEVIPVSRSTWYKGISEGRFPKGVKFGARITMWPTDEIRKLIHGFA